MTEPDARRFEWQLTAVAAGCVVVAVLALTVFPGVLADSPPGIPTGAILGSSAGVLFGFAALCTAGVWLHHRWFFTERQALRRALGPPDDWLNLPEWRRTASPDAIRGEAARFWGRPDATADQAGWVVGEVISGRWPMREKLLRAPYPRSVLVLGPQGSGKSQYAIPIILDLPAAAVITSTKSELLDATAPWRARLGPVSVFDPLGVTGGRHNVAFDPVTGCHDGERAEVAAAAMIRGASLGGTLRDGFWADAGRQILRCYLLAAALAGGSSFEVQHWSHHPDDPEPLRILEAHPGRVPEGWISNLRARLDTSRRQRDGYFGTVIATTEYLGHPGGAAAVRAARDTRGGPFDMARFLAEHATLYVVGDATKQGLAAMMTALTELIAYDARETAKTTKRLPEPLGMVLDEVANLTPVDLPRWVTEFRGWGIVPFAFVQSRAQLDTVWGHDDADVIFDNMITRVILRDLAAAGFLDDLSRLAGERQLRRPATTGSRWGRGEDVPAGTERLIPPHVIRSLPMWHALILGPPAQPAVVAFEPGYERLARQRIGTPYRARWPRWWRHPITATRTALTR
ncbi:type IV secretory system conjugative DNA transfer family protein [Actinomycetospora sp.]|jgi:hypothetical protein|uniref:type IV secretory system conjugative DNA transfer family protein n=1 Tax=Actinomycetospora sp. TaxID=1872135 RepID=UPI002F3EE320